jgi:hypothetical protein
MKLRKASIVEALGVLKEGSDPVEQDNNSKEELFQDTA